MAVQQCSQPGCIRAAGHTGRHSGGASPAKRKSSGKKEPTKRALPAHDPTVAARLYEPFTLKTLVSIFSENARIRPAADGGLEVVRP